MSLKDAFSRQDVMKVVKFSVMLGGGFGLATVLTYSLLLSPTPLPFQWFVVIPLAAASISTLAGMTGILLDWLLGPQLAEPGLRRLVIFVLVAFVVIGGAGILFISRFGREVKRQYFWGAAVGSLLGAAVSYLDYRLGEMRRRMAALEKENRLLAEIAQKDRELQEAIRTLAIAEERNRMARELHDSISQGIHGIIYAIRSLYPHLPPDDRRAGEILAHLAKTAEATLDELRAMIMELKPSILNEHGLVEALRLQAELFARRHRLELVLVLAAVAGLTPVQEMA
ncbi:MAG: hypothetical protein K6U03_06795, partial [Firmicutes bacterium]|nr:hypothetical protein [Bacillota bacterium]